MFPSRSAPSTGSLQLKAVQAAAQGFGINAQVFEARRAADIAEAFYALDRSRFQGLLLLLSPLIGGNPQLVADLAIRRNLPTISLFPEIARAGGLLGYGPDIQDLFRQGACFASSFSSVALAEEFVEWRRHTEASPVKRQLLPPAS